MAPRVLPGRRGFRQPAQSLAEKGKVKDKGGGGAWPPGASEGWDGGLRGQRRDGPQGPALRPPCLGAGSGGLVSPLQKPKIHLSSQPV